jgi:hypothetical protein
LEVKHALKVAAQLPSAQRTGVADGQESDAGQLENSLAHEPSGHRNGLSALHPDAALHWEVLVWHDPSKHLTGVPEAHPLPGPVELVVVEQEVACSMHAPLIGHHFGCFGVHPMATPETASF